MTEERQIPNIWYRYEILNYADSFRIYLTEYTVKKRTPKGVRLHDWSEHGKLVLFDANKQFACSSVEEAKISFTARKISAELRQ